MRRSSDVCSPRGPGRKERGCHPRTNGAAEARPSHPAARKRGSAATVGSSALPGSHRAQSLPPPPPARAGCAGRSRAAPRGRVSGLRAFPSARYLRAINRIPNRTWVGAAASPPAGLRAHQAEGRGALQVPSGPAQLPGEVPAPRYPPPGGHRHRAAGRPSVHPPIAVRAMRRGLGTGLTLPWPRRPAACRGGRDGRRGRRAPCVREARCRRTALPTPTARRSPRPGARAGLAGDGCGETVIFRGWGRVANCCSQSGDARSSSLPNAVQADPAGLFNHPDTRRAVWVGRVRPCCGQVSAWEALRVAEGELLRLSHPSPCPAQLGAAWSPCATARPAGLLRRARLSVAAPPCCPVPRH